MWNPYPFIYLKPEKRYPFRAEPPHTGHHKEYSPREGGGGRQRISICVCRLFFSRFPTDLSQQCRMPGVEFCQVRCRFLPRRMSDFFKVGCRTLTIRMSDVGFQQVGCRILKSDVGFYQVECRIFKVGCRILTSRMSDVGFLKSDVGWHL